MGLFFFFRDLDHESNLQNDKTYHAAGIVNEVYSLQGSPSGKDLAVSYLHPYDCTVHYVWRSVAEVELFEVSELEWKQAEQFYLSL